MKMKQSTSRKGTFWNNSPIKRIFSSLKHEQFYYERFETKEAVKINIIDYFAFYIGRYSTLGYKTPLEFERGFHSKVA
jgi:transposase InsO family protein